MVSVRHATAADRPALVALMAGLNAFEHGLRPDRDTSWEAAEAHLDYLLGLVERFGGFTLIAELDDTPVGFLLALIEEEEGAYVVPEHRRHGIISDMFVDEAARGKGVAKAMLRETDHRFRTVGIDRIQVTALTANEAADASYRAAGYKPLYTNFEKMLSTSD